MEVPLTKPTKKQPKEQNPKRKRGRPGKLVKIDDSPRNVARALFGMPSDSR